MEGIKFILFLIPNAFAVGLFLSLLAAILDRYTGFLSSKWQFLFYLVVSVFLYWLTETGLFLDEIKAKEQMAQLCDPKNASTKVMPKEVYGKTVRIVWKETQLNTAIPIEHTQFIYVDIKTNQPYLTRDMYIAQPGWFGRLLAKHQMYDGSSGPSKFRRICSPNVINANAKELHEKYQITLIE